MEEQEKNENCSMKIVINICAIMRLEPLQVVTQCVECVWVC